MIMGLSNDLKVKVGAEKNCVQSVTVEWPSARVKEKVEEAFKSVQGQAKLPGFRPGKSPIDLVRKQFKDTAYTRAQDIMLREGVTEALKVKKINAIQSPVIQSVKFDPEKTFQFEFKVEVAPQIKLSNYKGYKLNRKSTTVGEDEVKQALDKIVDANAQLVESKDEKVETKHSAVVNYEGFIDGKPIEGAKAENFLINMSAPQAIDGLAEGILGVKVGTEKDVKVTFPKESPAKELAGKEATFKIKVNALKEKKAANLDDEFAKDLGLKSLDELKTKVKENITKEKTQGSKKDLENQIADKLVEDNKFAVPQSLVDNQVRHLTQRHMERMVYQGVPKEDQVKAIDRVKADLQKQAEKDVKLAFILNAIGEAEKIEVTKEEIQARMDEIVAQTADNQKESVKKALQGQYLDKIRAELKDNKLFDKIASLAKIKEISGGSK